MRKLALLATVLVMTVGVGSAIKVFTLARSASTAAPPEVTISIDDIQRKVDANSLPVREVREPF